MTNLTSLAPTQLTKGGPSLLSQPFFLRNLCNFLFFPRPYPPLFPFWDQWRRFSAALGPQALTVLLPFFGATSSIPFLKPQVPGRNCSLLEVETRSSLFTSVVSHPLALTFHQLLHLVDCPFALPIFFLSFRFPASYELCLS